MDWVALKSVLIGLCIALWAIWGISTLYGGWRGFVTGSVELDDVGWAVFRVMLVVVLAPSFFSGQILPSEWDVTGASMPALLRSVSASLIKPVVTVFTFAVVIGVVVGMARQYHKLHYGLPSDRSLGRLLAVVAGGVFLIMLVIVFANIAFNAL